MKLPNHERAIVDIIKLRDYCLSPHHSRGRHKARVFASSLGLAQKDAEFLRSALLEAASNREAIPTDQDEYGQRFLMDFPMSGSKGEVIVRSSWIVLKGENYPRLTSCYVL